MTNNITTNAVVDIHDFNQSFLLNQYVHDKIRIPLEDLFQERKQIVIDEKSELVSDTEGGNLQANHLNTQNIWSTKVEPILNQIMLLSESTKQKTIGFIGESGSGKSSLINSILDYDLLPTDGADTCTASISAISSWKESYYQLFVYFISKERWQLESNNAYETRNLHSNNSEDELPDDVKAFMYKQAHLFNSDDTNEDPLDDLPEHVQKRMGKGYELYESNELNTLKKQLNEFAAKDGLLWPIVDKIYIRGPFTKLSNDLILLDIPGYGDGYEEMTIRAVEATAICDQVVHVVRGDGRAPLQPSFLKSLLRSSTSLKHISLVVTHRNTAAQSKKQKVSNESIEEQYKEKLREKGRDIPLDNFPKEYIARFIDDLPVYYVENKCAGEKWSEDNQSILKAFVDKELNNIVTEELNQTRYDIISNINILLKFLSVELSQPLCEVISNEELSPLTKECLDEFETKTKCSESLFKEGSKELWEKYFWPIINKKIYVSPHKYDTFNYQTLRKNLIGDYVEISTELSSSIIDVSKIDKLPTAEVLFKNAVFKSDLLSLFRNKFFPSLKKMLREKNVQGMDDTVDQYDKKIEYHIKKLKKNFDSQLRFIKIHVKEQMDNQMRDEIQNRLWIDDGLHSVSGNRTKEQYLASLQKFITELNTIDLNFIEKLYKRLSRHFQQISNAFSNFTNDINATINSMTLGCKIDNTFKEKVLLVLVPLSLEFTQNDVSNIDQSLEEDSELQNHSLPAIAQLQITEQWTLSNIHTYNQEILSPIPKVYTNISTNYVCHGEVYVLSNKDMPYVYKIGYTTIGVKRRAGQLYTTGVPSRFIIEKVFTCYNCKLFEQWMHKLFLKHRTNTGREFFRVPLKIIIDVGNILDTIMKEKFENS
ncbi:hypothetical protein I4U23_031123 [Adineta vaga]|nr:hypothetical protein I4U23_031123 [Adineta vaga]